VSDEPQAARVMRAAAMIAAPRRRCTGIPPGRCV
jgi:hypothetical protein